MTSLVPKTPFELKAIKEKYLEYIAEGMVEKHALERANFKKGEYIRAMLDDADFVKAIETARRHRAEHWVGEIAASYDVHHPKDEVAGAKLIFDKLAYLAKADNPERYGNSAKGANININLGEFKMLPPDEARKVLASDPFAIDADYIQIPPEEEDEGDLL